MGGPVSTRRVVSFDDVVGGACRFFLRNATLDMAGLAGSMAISRATLYRVVHSRDGLLGEVLWRLGERVLTTARRRRTRDGVDGVLEVTRLFVDYLHAAASFPAFLRAEPDTAARVLFNAAGGVHPRAVQAQKEILTETGVGVRWSPATMDQAAFLYVRIVESALYAELLSSRRLDLRVAERAARAVLDLPG